MAATNVIKKSINCQLCVRPSVKSCKEILYCLQSRSKIHFISSSKEFSFRHVHLSHNCNRILQQQQQKRQVPWQRRILPHLPTHTRMTALKVISNMFSTYTSDIEQDLEDIKHLLATKFSNDENLSEKQLEDQMIIIDILLQNRLNPVPQEILQDATSKASPSELYSLASNILLLQNTVGEEASLVATPLFRIAALAGDRDAKYSYGQLLFRGAGGLEADPVQAGSMFTELAKEGHGFAQFALAGMYYAGYGVDQSYETSYTLYQVSAENGIIQSYNSIGKMYLHGQSVDKDEKKAMEYFIKGAEAGDVQACMSVGHCYSNGKGVEIDYDQAFVYHNKAAEKSYAPGIYNVGTHYFSGKGIGLDMQKAAECFQRAADMGFSLAEINLGNMYYHGLGVEKNWSKAKELYQRAAPKHHNARLLLEELELEEKRIEEEKKEEK